MLKERNWIQSIGLACGEVRFRPAPPTLNRFRFKVARRRSAKWNAGGLNPCDFLPGVHSRTPDASILSIGRNRTGLLLRDRSRCHISGGTPLDRPVNRNRFKAARPEASAKADAGDPVASATWVPPVPVGPILPATSIGTPSDCHFHQRKQTKTTPQPPHP